MEVELLATATEPRGWGVRVAAGWSHFAIPDPDRDWSPGELTWAPVAIGANTYPSLFEMILMEEGAAPTSSDFVVMAWRWDGSEFQLQGVSSLGPSSVSSVLEQPIGLKSVGFWRRKALLHLAWFDATSNPTHVWESAKAHEWSDADRAVAYERAGRAVAVPGSQRRDRVSVAVLEEAAEVYRTAWREGRNPTRAVQDHFHKSHSTAARWVGQARKLGILGPSDGSRGGELEVPGE